MSKKRVKYTIILTKKNPSIINNNQGQLSLKRHKVAYQTIYVSETSENVDS